MTRGPSIRIDGWFWNRASVYKAFGFDRFMSEETLPLIAKRGPLAADAALSTRSSARPTAQDRPFFYFAVTLAGPRPYEPNRYPDSKLKVESPMSEAGPRRRSRPMRQASRTPIASLKRLIDWASKRERPTVIAFFGDHLPPLGPVYTETGFMKDIVADRNAPLGANLPSSIRDTAGGVVEPLRPGQGHRLGQPVVPAATTC